MDHSIHFHLGSGPAARPTVEVVQGAVGEREDPEDWNVLAPDERVRAERLRRPSARAQFVATRAALRRILGRRIKVEPAKVEFRIRAGGKPELAGAGAESGWRFNVSHTDGLYLIALALGFEVGIDVERGWNPGVGELAGLVVRHFSPAERTLWESSSESEAMSVLLRIWTRKEAVLKASGLGLVEDLRSVDTVSPGLSQGRWGVIDWPVSAGYAAAISAEGLGWVVHNGDATDAT